MKILNIKPFVITTTGDLGIAVADGPFASSAWRISDEAFRSVRGSKFAWIAPNGGEYTDNRGIFLRPTEEHVMGLMTPQLQEIALKENLIELE